MSEKLKLRLTVDITYDLNGEDPGVLERYLEEMVSPGHPGLRRSNRK